MFEIVKAKKSESGDIRKIIKSSLCNIVAKHYSEEIVGAIYNYYSEDKINDYEKVLVAKEGQKIVGCIAYEKNELKMLYPDPEFRKKVYIAEMLLTFAKNDLAENGYFFGWGNALDSSVRFLEKHHASREYELEEVLEGKRFRVTRMKFPLR